MADYINSTGQPNTFVTNDTMSTGFQNITEDYFADYNSVSTDITDMPEQCVDNRTQEMSVRIVHVALFLIVFLLGVIGNGLVIATFTKYRCLRLRCMTDVFLFYLALSDLLLLLTLPLRTVEVIYGGWTLSDKLCKLNNSMYAINMCGGLLLLACISVDRYMVVVHARAAQRLGPSMLFYSKLSAAAVAIISTILSLPEIIFSEVMKEEAEDLGRCMMDVENNIWVKNCARVTKIAGFCVPCITMLVCYSTIAHVLQQGKGKCWRKQRTLRLMAALVWLFLLFQLPYTIVLFIRLFMQTEDCDTWSRINLSEEITHSLVYVRCCLNPVLYALMGVRFRNDVMRLLQDCSCMCTFLKNMMPQPSHGSSVTPSSPPPTTLSPLSSANGLAKFSFANDTNPELNNDAKESCATTTDPLFAQQSKDCTYVSWGQH